MNPPDQSPSREVCANPVSWVALKRFTDARVALSRTGGSVRTETLIDLRLGHARARDAVMKDFDLSCVESCLKDKGIDFFRLATAASDRKTYLAHPDLGRRLSEESKTGLLRHKDQWGSRQLAIILSDGLSALATERHAVTTIDRLIPLLRAGGWSIFPIFVSPFARVKLQDQVGQLLGARHTLMLVGERPGLSAPDSLGAYFTFEPSPSCTDADRNCISNIRSDGLPPSSAARKIASLLIESARRGVSGVGLKETDLD